ncbi:MAG: hypothetical protein ACI4GC_08375 [Acutalibacteraceae bacterium]
MFIIKKIVALFMCLSLSLVAAIDNGGEDKLQKGEYAGSKYFSGADFRCSTQGITNDGEYYYTTGAVVALGFNGLQKIDIKTGEVVLQNTDAMPAELKKQMFNHLGGCTYFEGKIYVAVEDLFRKHPCIAVFSAETLEFTGEYKILGEEVQPNGNLPWCAVDEENRILYTGVSRGGEFVNAIDIDTLELIEKKPIEHSLHRIQGAEFYKGLLYISCNDETKVKHVYTLDPDTGEIVTLLERKAGTNSVEAEGITVRESDDEKKVLLDVIDVINSSNSVIRTYEVK